MPPKQRFSTTYICQCRDICPPGYLPVSGDIFGCHFWEDRAYWPLVSRGQECYWTSRPCFCQCSLFADRVLNPCHPLHWSPWHWGCISMGILVPVFSFWLSICKGFWEHLHWFLGSETCQWHLSESPILTQMRINSHEYGTLSFPRDPWLKILLSKSVKIEVCGFFVSSPWGDWPHHLSCLIYKMNSLPSWSDSSFMSY